jgi:hypothetical protein
MKHWSYPKIPNWTDYQQQFQTFILEQTQNNVHPYQYVSVATFEKCLPEFKDFLENHFESEIERIMVFTMTQNTMNSMFGDKFIHIDSGEKTARLNWPILNPLSVVTKYFDIVDPTAEPKRLYINPPQKDYIDIYDSSACKETESFCVDQPTVFTVNQQAHGMFINGDTWPRVIASINFFDESGLLKYL